ncbi:ABC transporter substrate-binding protein [Actinopolymorpha rutila]|uniref:Putative aldouronate transport system substrate-binding protein n=1 Tax=Actinopolymorpha rutila TaxID=446787 RepID=A0A852ZF03_9ACTN|nr:ABC transporter substrate-binding protein [Actinopolymorpha rutila]NYH90745.1 putative aldouronate transport system substrate-binding protein [Actinopolymorpha rutila]
MYRRPDLPSGRPLLSRRSFLHGAGAVVGGLTAGSVLAACGEADRSTTASKKLVFLEPGDVPSGWNRVPSAVNKKLAADTGLTLDIRWIGWSNYSQAELLKYTSKEKFTGSLEADWLHHAKLAGDGAIFDLDTVWKAKKYPNLVETINERTIQTSKFGGKLWGVPQVNNATSLIGFMIRQDLADGEVETFEEFERFLYGVKQKKSSMIPYGMDNGYINSSLSMFDADSWEGTPEYIGVPVSNIPILLMRTADARAGKARVVPIWEVPSKVDTAKRVRKYYTDGILNHDLLNVDKKTIYSLFGQGKFGAAVGVTDGLMTTTYGGTLNKVPGARLTLTLPYADKDAKQLTTFGASNHVAFNVEGDQLDDGMRFLEWLSARENHDLLEYGVEGTDWEADDEKSITAKSEYVFPGYTMSWRIPLERRPSDMIESEKRWLDYAQSFDNFELSPLAGFSLKEQPIKTQLAQFSAMMARYLRPVQAGSVDVNRGLDAMKKGFSGAGLDKAVAEVEKQLGAFFAASR